MKKKSIKDRCRYWSDVYTLYKNDILAGDTLFLKWKFHLIVQFSRFRIIWQVVQKNIGMLELNVVNVSVCVCVRERRGGRPDGTRSV